MTLSRESRPTCKTPTNFTQLVVKVSDLIWDFSQIDQEGGLKCRGMYRVGKIKNLGIKNGEYLRKDKQREITISPREREPGGDGVPYLT